MCEVLLRGGAGAQDIYSKSVLKKFRGGKNVPEKKIGGARATLCSLAHAITITCGLLDNIEKGETQTEYYSKLGALKMSW